MQDRIERLFISVRQGRLSQNITPLSFNRQHYEIDDCLEDNREDY